jgi:hydrogenase/urease accessory protein HupE
MPTRPLVNRSGLLVAACLALASVAESHEARPLYVHIDEQQALVFAVRALVPDSVPDLNVPSVVMPVDCSPLPPESAGAGATSHVALQIYRCEEPLFGKRIDIAFPAFNPSLSSLLELETLSGVTYAGVLGPGDRSWRVPRIESVGQVLLRYTELGIGHILFGYDHLLFLVCLVIIAQTTRRIVFVVTGFTIAHSITLIATTFGLVSPPVGIVEVMIALSIVFAASEVARNRADTLIWRYPIVFSSLFGLLHGFGFAGALQDIGLPQTHLIQALLFFNLGVEAGQLSVIAAGALIWHSIRRSGANLSSLRPATAYTAGILAAFWTLDRLAVVI